MTILTREMIDAFPVANMHVHLPGVISAKTALELGLRNNLCSIKDGQIHSENQLPNIPSNVRYKKYSDIFKWDSDERGEVTNIRYDISHRNFDEFDQVMGIVQGHKFSYKQGGKDIAVGGIQNGEDLTFILDKYLQNCHLGKIKYVELKQNLRLAQVIFPDLSEQDALNAMLDILKQAQEKFASEGVGLAFINCFNKSSNLSSGEEAELRAVKAANKLLQAQGRYEGLFVGIDGAGNELLEQAHPRHQREGYEMAAKNGFKLDAHAAEAKDAQMIIDTYEALNTKFMGHGILVVESEAVKRYSINRDITFFVCPTMNMFLGTSIKREGQNNESVLVKDIWQHPVWEMMRQSVDGKNLRVSLATDNPALGGIPYKEMLLQLAGLMTEVTGHPPENMSPLTAEELYESGKNSIDAIPSLSERIKYQAELDSWAKLSNLEVGLPKNVRG